MNGISSGIAWCKKLSLGRMKFYYTRLTQPLGMIQLLLVMYLAVSNNNTLLWIFLIGVIVVPFYLRLDMRRILPKESNVGWEATPRAMKVSTDMEEIKRDVKEIKELLKVKK